jgi:hypothetical protein
VAIKDPATGRAERSLPAVYVSLDKLGATFLTVQIEPPKSSLLTTP